MASYLTLFVMMTGVWCSSPPPVDVDIDKMVGRFYVVSILFTTVVVHQQQYSCSFVYISGCLSAFMISKKDYLKQRETL